MTVSKFKAGEPFPTIVLPTVGGNELTLGKPRLGFDWRMVVIYRGIHCPLCTHYLNELERLKPEFNKLGIDIIAVSADSQIQATDHQLALTASYPVAYSLSIVQMQQLGLYISHPRSEKETDHLFAEPGLFVVNDRGLVQVIDISNGPFVRPDLEVLLSGLGFIRNPENKYPIRGTYE